MSREPAIDRDADARVTPPSPVGVHDWLGGVTDKLVDKTVDPDSHNLHLAVGHVCPTCGKLIEPNQSVRRMVSGAYKHDAC
ncbi:MAG: hypothetical protein J2P57_22950 [Acidimicrobiaceae bacterium]|nr:hypothetical protein [Acidimicrobiaceae bacterium]